MGFWFFRNRFDKFYYRLAGKKSEGLFVKFNFRSQIYSKTVNQQNNSLRTEFN
jgi:hypothetical protein